MSARQKKHLFLGIDLGSVTLTYVLLDRNHRIHDHTTVCHHGKITPFLEQAFRRIHPQKVAGVAFTKRAADFFAGGDTVNEQIALVEGIRLQAPDARSVFVIGGEMFGLILFDEEHRYQKFISNSSCAAGTGAFLDQQASRLNLASTRKLTELAEQYEGNPPKIATRCAVFAKTDLAHCQQQGYSLEAIAAGLCHGLAQNIADTLLKGVELHPPVIAVGGVSKNRKVIRYLAEIIDSPITVPENPDITVALGCARIASQFVPSASYSDFSLPALLKTQTRKKQYFFPPLSPRSTVFPDFHDHHRYVMDEVEVDVYQPPESNTILPVYMGIDIGSTSTKAILLQATGHTDGIVLGLYTRTRGQPIAATQALFRELHNFEQKYGIRFQFAGTGTTGSGRKFIQRVVHADLAIDEITAHARAACALNPKVDTIIEIGGQDSKFTVLRDGHVTFSVMNYVCAAGTGSFIEEQAKKLGVRLEDYATRASTTPAPLTSDRCTVFMERDLNYLLSQGYTKEELLAAALHSVRDNYLSKVAQTSRIGEVICFQGATAKNFALVTAFEQKLQKPIFVSRYCHLTGALGVCFILKEQNYQESTFCGLEFYREKPNVHEEICDDCKNHCKLNQIRIGQEIIQWGHLCGRDENGMKQPGRHRSGFDLLSSRRKIFLAPKIQSHHNPHSIPSPEQATLPNERGFSLDFSFHWLRDIDLHFSLRKLKQLDVENPVTRLRESLELNLLQLRHYFFSFTREDSPPLKEKNRVRIGIPNTLYLWEYAPFWRMFFETLGYSVVVSTLQGKWLKEGKRITGAEFCAPISCWHGHVKSLLSRCDYLFLPHMLSEEEKDRDRFYCYYSNYAVALVANAGTLPVQERLLTPVINFAQPVIETIHQLYESLPGALKLLQTPNEIKEAFTLAWSWYLTQKRKSMELFLQQTRNSTGISVVLLGRPYVVFDPCLNKNIPAKFNDLGIKVFFQDMLPSVEEGSDFPGKEYMEWNHWKFARAILNAAEYLGRKKGLYPVFLTAFKCSPDSFVLPYFREIMESYRKPYLVLQIDDHDSDVGYETRIEAAIRTFRSDHRKKRSPRKHKKVLQIDRSFSKNGTVLIPNYDSLSCSLICAAFERAGYQARLIEESSTTIQTSIRRNDGQCLPISVIVQGAIETIKRAGLEPENTAIFLNALSAIPCNLPQYPLMIRHLLHQAGEGFEKVHVFATEFELRGFPFAMVYDIYCAYLLGGLLRRLGCTIRPYEIFSGTTDHLLEEARQRLYHCIAAGESKEAAFREIVERLAAIPHSESSGSRPKVAIVGDLYVRDNHVFNQRLIHELESYGAEVITTPFNYIVRMLAAKHNYSLLKEGRYLAALRDKFLVEIFERFEKQFYEIAGKILPEQFPDFDDSIFDPLKHYHISLKHSGETAQNVMKIFSLRNHYPDISLIIHVNPIFCCPGLVSEAIFKKIESEIGIPIVSIVYDGTMSNKNELLAPYVFYIRKAIPPSERLVSSL